MSTIEIAPQEVDEIRARVRDKYGELAKAAGLAAELRGACCQPASAKATAESQAGGCCQPTSADPITSNLYGRQEASDVPKPLCWLRLDAATPPRWPRWLKVRRCSTWAPEAASMCCSAKGGAERVCLRPRHDR